MYGDCAACGAAGAPVKCQCLGAHYCNVQCQKAGISSHRKECTTVLLKKMEAKREALLQLQTSRLSLQSSGHKDSVRKRAHAEAQQIRTEEKELAHQLNFVSELIRIGLDGKIHPQLRNFPIAEQNCQEAIKLWRKLEEDFRDMPSQTFTRAIISSTNFW